MSVTKKATVNLPKVQPTIQSMPRKTSIMHKELEVYWKIYRWHKIKQHEICIRGMQSLPGTDQFLNYSLECVAKKANNSSSGPFIYHFQFYFDENTMFYFNPSLSKIVIVPRDIREPYLALNRTVISTGDRKKPVYVLKEDSDFKDKYIGPDDLVTFLMIVNYIVQVPC